MVKEFVPEMRSDKKDAEIERLKKYVFVLRDNLHSVCALAQIGIENISDREQQVIDYALAALAATEEK